MVTHHMPVHPAHSFGELLEAQITVVITVHSGKDLLQIGHGRAIESGAGAAWRAVHILIAIAGFGAVARRAVGASFPAWLAILAAFGKPFARGVQTRLELVARYLAVAVLIRFGEPLFELLRHLFRQFIEHDCPVIAAEAFEHVHRAALGRRAGTIFVRRIGPGRCRGQRDHCDRRRYKVHLLHHTSP